MIKLFTLSLLLLFPGCVHSDSYTLTVIERMDTYYAEYLQAEDGSDMEERYDGILLSIAYKNKIIDEIVAYQLWFSPDYIEYPEIGTEFNVTKFDYKKDRLLGLENFDMGYNMEYSQLLQLQK